MKLYSCSSKVIISSASEPLNLGDVSSDAAPVRKTKGLVQRGREGGGGVTSVNYGGVCSMLPESLALPQIKIHNFPSCQETSDRRKHIIFKSLVSERTAYFVSKQKGVTSHNLYNLRRAVLQFIVYIRSVSLLRAT